MCFRYGSKSAWDNWSILAGTLDTRIVHKYFIRVLLDRLEPLNVGPVRVSPAEGRAILALYHYHCRLVAISLAFFSNLVFLSVSRAFSYSLICAL